MANQDFKPSSIPSRNPLPLSATQESQVRELYYKRVRDYCAQEIRDFAFCTTNRTISMLWACRTQRAAMDSCMLKHATREEQDAAREAWFAAAPQRKREREEKEKKNQKIMKEQEKFQREWWGLPPLPDENSGENSAGEKH